MSCLTSSVCRRRREETRAPSPYGVEEKRTHSTRGAGPRIIKNPNRSEASADVPGGVRDVRLRRRWLLLRFREERVTTKIELQFGDFSGKKNLAGGWHAQVLVCLQRLID